jgi:succinate dehydrogenase / fumarate reductase iron-sulfur subunit
MQKEAFGNCTNQYECETVCPKEISVRFIARMNRDWFKAALGREEEEAGGGVG